MLTPTDNKDIASREWLDPTEYMISTPEFEAVWQCIKDWDIHVPGAYVGYSGATGNHVRAILDALKKQAKAEQKDEVCS